MSWHLAPSLVELFAEVNLRWPKRDKSSDGTIGDTAHAARTSEHNPDHDSDGMPLGAVSAIDITKDSAAMIEAVRKALIADPRTWYVIHNGYIWSRTHDFAKQKYNGANPHVHHLHVSLMQTKAAHDSTKSWGIAKAAAPKPEPAKPSGDVKPFPVLSKGDSEPILVPFLKRYFGLDRINTTPLFGEGTRAAVIQLQKREGLTPDGVVGPKTWAAIKAGGTLLPPGYRL
jgi:hypothetical protein